jgi:type IV pilus assembly protein PilE
MLVPKDLPSKLWAPTDIFGGTVMKIKPGRKGITLIELLTVIAIVGILAAIAIPVYRGYMQRARRADAKTALEQTRAAQEMRRAEMGSYRTGTSADIITALQTSWGGPAATVGDYALSFTVTTGTTFTARATPNTSRQSGDGWLAIDHLGNKTSEKPDRWGK